MKRPTLKELPPSERPYERCERLGPHVLSDAELISIIIKSGYKNSTCVDVAREMLSAKSLSGLGTMTIKELTAFKGIGRIKAIQLQCAFELSRRLVSDIFVERPSLNCPEAIFNAFGTKLMQYTVEHVMLIMLDSKLRLVKDMLITKGTVNSALVSPRDIFIAALKNDAVYLVVMHNHPSGDPSPSKEDDSLTERLFRLGKMLDLDLMDHIIIGKGCYYSYLESGRIINK